MGIVKWISSGDPYKRFSTNQLLFEGLRDLDNAAILFLQEKSLAMVRKIVSGFRLPDEKAEEILNTSTLIFLQKIGSGAYVFQGHAPSTYFFEIVKRQAHMATRTRKGTLIPLDEVAEAADPDAEMMADHQEASETVTLLLDKLGDPCKTVVRLHHVDGYSDEEVIDQQLTRYSTVNSLKMKRSDCMKKLVTLAQQWKTSTAI